MAGTRAIALEDHDRSRNPEQTVPVSVLSNDDGTYSLCVAFTNLQQTVTPNVAALDVAGTSTGTVPAGSKGWVISWTTNGGTLNGVSVPQGLTLSSGKVNFADVVVTTLGKATVYWES